VAYYVKKRIVILSYKKALNVQMIVLQNMNVVQKIKNVKNCFYKIIMILLKNHKKTIIVI